jgi:type IV secretion system protein TrbL
MPKIRPRVAVIRHPLFALLLIVCCIAVIPSTAGATSLDTVLDAFQASAGTFASKLAGLGMRLLLILAGIELVLILVEHAIKGSSLDEVVATVVRFVLITGFFIAFLNNNQTWAQAIIDSFRDAGFQASGVQGTGPSQLFNAGWNVATAIFKAGTNNGISINGIVVSLTYVVLAIVEIIVFSVMAAHFCMALIESYLAIGAGTLLLGFGGSRLTSGIAIGYIRYVVSVGVRLFVVELVIGIMINIAPTLVTSLDQTIGSAFDILGVSILLFVLSAEVPKIAGGLISGTSYSTGSFAAIAVAGAVGAAVAGAAAFAGGAAGGAAGAAATGTGGRLAGAGLRAAQILSQGVAKAAGHPGGTASGAGAVSQAASFIGKRTGGAPKSLLSTLRNSINSKPPGGASGGSP